MEYFLVDTNLLISYVVDRNPRQSKLAEDIFKRATSLEIELVVSNFAISEFIFVLQSVYSKSDLEISEMINALLLTPGISIIDGFQIERVLKLWPSHIPDYGDAVLASIAKKENFPFLTFDKPLSKKLQKLKIPFKLLH